MMKPTGIIRRIDDLGRIVVPKDVRRTMRIEEGDPLEIYTDPANDQIILKRYRPENNIDDVLRRAQYEVRREYDDGHIDLDRAKRMTEAISSAREACAEADREGQDE